MTFLSKARLFTLAFVQTLLLAVLPGGAFAQSAAVSVPTVNATAGTSISYPVNFSAGATGVTAIQFDLLVPSGGTLTVSSISAGAVATAAGKSIASSNLTNGVRVIIFGLNQTPISSGVLANLQIGISPSAAGNQAITLANVVSSSADGVDVPTTITNGAIVLASPSFSISGTVTRNGVALSGVSINGGALGSTSTNASGQFSFANVPSGTSYTITPSLSGHSFAPASASGTVSGNVSLSFTATQLFTVSGTVTRNGVALSGVSINGGALGSTSTNASGQFSFANVPSGTSYTITPSLNGYSFSPVSASGTVSGNVSLSFTADPRLFKISGTVRKNGAPLPGVAVSAAALGNAVSDANGQFSFANVPTGTSYSITPSLDGHTFSPGSATGAVNGDVALSFSAEPQSVTISGVVLKNGVPLSGVAIDAGALGSVTSDANGQFSIANVAPGTAYTLTPSLPGYIFTPASASGTADADVSLSFAAQSDPSAMRSISGVISAGGVPLANVIVDGGALGSRTTDANGAYLFEQVLVGSQYQVTPSKQGYSFFPSAVSGVISENVRADFSGTEVACVGTDCASLKLQVSGRVTAGNKALARATVKLGALRVRTDQNGAYIFSGVAPGTYPISVSVKGYTFSSTAAPNGSITLVRSSLSNVDFIAACAKSGYVVASDGKCVLGAFSISGSVVVEGQPLAGAIVTSGKAKAKVDAQGRYTLRGLRSGTYTIRVSGKKLDSKANRGRALAVKANLSGIDFAVRCADLAPKFRAQCQSQAPAAAAASVGPGAPNAEGFNARTFLMGVGNKVASGESVLMTNIGKGESRFALRVGADEIEFSLAAGESRSLHLGNYEFAYLAHIEPRSEAVQYRASYVNILEGVGLEKSAKEFSAEPVEVAQNAAAACPIENTQVRVGVPGEKAAFVTMQFGKKLRTVQIPAGGLKILDLGRVSTSIALAADAPMVVEQEVTARDCNTNSILERR